MRQITAVLSTTMLGVLAALPVQAEGVAEPDPNVFKLEVYDAYAQAAKAGGSSSVRMLLVNPTSSTLQLVGAVTNVADQTLLQTYTEGPQGLARVKSLHNLALPARSEVVLAPGVLELQLVGLVSDLEPGLELPMQLKFADGTARTVRIKIEGEEI